MPNYTYLDLFKRRAKLFSQTKNLKLSVAQEQLARESGFTDFHELQTVSKRSPGDPRLAKAGLGVTEPGDILYEQKVYAAVEQEIEEALAGEIAETNASNFTLENLEVLESNYCQRSGVGTVRFSGDYIGEQDSDRIYHDHSFPVHAEIRARKSNDQWALSDDEGFEIQGICVDCETVMNVSTVLDDSGEPTARHICDRCLEHSESYGTCALCSEVFELKDLKPIPGGQLACSEHIDDFYLDPEEEEGWEGNIERGNDL
ncbi:hypothetical protein [Marinobacter changyiensis]|uniref:hypothetical protein n=1 Tax=Marinobacter changyiensis TaxID=2604091 RepID=UPI001264D90A|nr:hypothetical protein [Marinobacter changyiensis]